MHYGSYETLRSLPVFASGGMYDVKLRVLERPAKEGDSPVVENVYTHCAVVLEYGQTRASWSEIGRTVFQGKIRLMIDSEQVP